jgi:hypothetical protein
VTRKFGETVAQREKIRVIYPGVAEEFFSPLQKPPLKSGGATAWRVLTCYLSV